jgi:hypothetical protein
LLCLGKFLIGTIAAGTEGNRGNRGITVARSVFSVYFVSFRCLEPAQAQLIYYMKILAFPIDRIINVKELKLPIGDQG